jgi:hypothetical protein
MTRDEHLDRIVAKCRELLAIAEGRTPGPWHWVNPSNDNPIDFTQFDERLVESARGTTIGEASLRSVRETRSPFGDYTLPVFLAESEEISKPNAAFIASCAGSAEAGWRATIAAIEGLRGMLSYFSSYVDNSAAFAGRDRIRDALDAIIAAWPEEML